jgi:hypothetical protein
MCACLCGDACLQSDYEAANFDVKKAKGYWQLGRLGLEETQELQAKVRRARASCQQCCSCTIVHEVASYVWLLP